MSGRGSVFKRCGCTEVVDGKRRQLGRACPNLKRPNGTWNPRHGTWCFKIYVVGERGKRDRVVRGGFASQAEAQAEMDEIKNKAAKGVDVTRRLTVSQFLAEWIDAKTDVKANTAHSYRRHIELYFEPLIGHILLSELRVSHVAEMLAQVGKVKGSRGAGRPHVSACGPPCGWLWGRRATGAYHRNAADAGEAPAWTAAQGAGVDSGTGRTVAGEVDKIGRKARSLKGSRTGVHTQPRSWSGGPISSAVPRSRSR